MLNAKLLPEPAHCDIAVIGTGFHGISIAREAKLRGLSAVLIHDRSIVHCPTVPYHAVIGAGIGKLESLNFTEVLSNYKEILHLHAAAPHLLQPCPTFIATNNSVRTSRRVKFGIRVYRSLQHKAACATDFTFNDVLPESLIGVNPEGVFTQYINEFKASPKRLLIALAQDAVQAGVTDCSNHVVTRSLRKRDHWQLHLQSTHLNATEPGKILNARLVVNCASSSIDHVLENILQTKSRCRSQIVNTAWVYINKPQQWQHALLLQRANRALVYVFAVNNRTLCAGPIVVHSNAGLEKQQAIQDVLQILNDHTTFQSTNDDIIRCEWQSESIIDDPSYKQYGTYNETFLDLNQHENLAPVISIFGTNVAKHQKIARQCCSLMEPFIEMRDERKNQNLLLSGTDYSQLTQNSDSQSSTTRNSLDLSTVHTLFANLPEELTTRLFCTYGSNMLRFVKPEFSVKQLGQAFGHGLYEAELRYLVQNEWVTSVDDVLWQNTNLGLLFDQKQTAQLADYLQKFFSSRS